MAQPELNQRGKRVAREVMLHQALKGRKRRRPIPKLQYPKLIESDYAAKLVAIAGSGMLARVLKPLLAELPRLVASAATQRGGAIPLVDPGARVAQLIGEARKQVPSRAELVKVATEYATRTSSHQREQLGKQLEAALGVNVLAGAGMGEVRFDSLAKVEAARFPHYASRSAGAMRHDAIRARVFRTDAVNGRVAGFASENATLVTSLGQQSLDDIAKTIERGFTNGDRHEELAKEIEARFSVFDSYARRIARDQVGKLNGQVTADRHESLGVKTFIWRTVGDERVRDEHTAIEGMEFEYPNGHPVEGLPGEPILCRCVAEPVFGPITSAVDGGEVDLDLPNPFLSMTGEEPAPQIVPIPVLPPAPPPPPPPPAPKPVNQIMAAVVPKPVNRIAAPVVPKLALAPPPPIAPALPLVAPVVAPTPPPSDKPNEAIKPRATEESAKQFLDGVADGKALTATEQSAVYRYQGGTYIDINEFARTNVLDPGSTLSTQEEAKETIAAIDSAIAKGSTPDDVLVFRGFRPEGATPREGITGGVEVGQTITDKGFTSTSMSKETAKEFGSVLLEIEVPKGTNAAFVPAAGGMQESELLLGRGSNFKVLEVREENGKKIARVRLEPPPPPAPASSQPLVTAPPKVEKAPPVEEKPKTGRELAAEARALRESMKPPKNPKRVAAAKIAAAASAERRAEIHSAARSNLPPELHATWDKEGHKFLQQEAGRIKGVKDRVNASSTISQAFMETYGSGAETVIGNEGDRYSKRSEIDAEHAENWADEQERKFYEDQIRNSDAEAAATGESGGASEDYGVSEETVSEGHAGSAIEESNANAESPANPADEEVPF